MRRTSQPELRAAALETNTDSLTGTLICWFQCSMSLLPTLMCHSPWWSQCYASQTAPQESALQVEGQVQEEVDLGQ